MAVSASSPARPTAASRSASPISRSALSATPRRTSSSPPTWLYSDGVRTPTAPATAASVTASRPFASARSAAAATTAAGLRPARGTGGGSAPVELGDGRVHRRAGRHRDVPVADGEPRGVERAQLLGGAQRGRPVPRREAGQREARVRLGRGRDAAERRERVARDKRPVAGVEERDLAGRVAGRGEDLERADPVAGREQAARTRLHLVVAAAQLALRLVGIEALVAGEEARVARGDRDLGLRQRGGERVERADVVAVGVRQRDPDDRRVELTRGGEDRVLAARDHRVDEREPVVLHDEERVDRTEAREADEVWGVAEGLHGGVLC